MKKVILVIGVERSGTSAITKGLESLGVFLGSTLIPGNNFNEKGFWEDTDFHSLNFEILNSFSGRYRRLVPLNKKEVTFLFEKGFQKKAIQLLHQKLPTDCPLGVKDPRFALLLPFWKKIFQECNVSPSFVIALRNPLSVAACHEQFKIQHREKSFWMWISHILNSLFNTEGSPRIIIDYDALLENPSFQMKRVAQKLHLEIKETLLKNYSNHFINPSLRHFHKIDDDLLNDSFSKKLVLEIYQKLLALTEDKITFEELSPFLQQWKEYFWMAESLLILEEKNSYTLHQLSTLNHQLHQKNQDLKNAKKEQDQTIIDLNRAMLEKLQFITTLCQTIEHRDRQLASLLKQN